MPHTETTTETTNDNVFYYVDQNGNLKPKTLVLSDWTGPQWSTNKIVQVQNKLAEYINEGFTIYILCENKITQFTATTISALEAHNLNKQMNLKNPTEIIEKIATKYALPAEQILILDSHWIGYLLRTEEKDIRRIFASDLLETIKQLNPANLFVEIKQQKLVSWIVQPTPGRESQETVTVVYDCFYPEAFGETPASKMLIECLAQITSLNIKTTLQHNIVLLTQSELDMLLTEGEFSCLSGEVFSVANLATIQTLLINALELTPQAIELLSQATELKILGYFASDHSTLESNTTQLSTLLSQFPALDTLILDTMQFFASDTSTSLPLTQLKKLELHSSEEISEIELNQMLLQAPNLEKFTFFNEEGHPVSYVPASVKNNALREKTLLFFSSSQNSKPECVSGFSEFEKFESLHEKPEWAQTIFDSDSDSDLEKSALCLRL